MEVITTVIYFDLGDCLTFKHTVSPRNYDELMKDFRTGKNANFANIEMKLDCEIHHSISSKKNLFPEQWKDSSNEEDRPGLYRTFDHQGVQIRVGTSFTIDATVSNLTARPDEVILTVMYLYRLSDNPEYIKRELGEIKQKCKDFYRRNDRTL